MKTMLAAALAVGLCGITAAQEKDKPKADPVGTWKCEYEIGEAIEFGCSTSVGGGGETDVGGADFGADVTAGAWTKSSSFPRAKNRIAATSNNARPPTPAATSFTGAPTPSAPSSASCGR